MICQLGVCGHRGLLGEQSQEVLSCVLIASMMHVMVQVWAVGQGQQSTTQPAQPLPSSSCPVAWQGSIVPLVCVYMSVLYTDDLAVIVKNL